MATLAHQTLFTAKHRPPRMGPRVRSRSRTVAASWGDTFFAAFAMATPANSANLLFRRRIEKIIIAMAARPSGFRAKATPRQVNRMII